MAQGAPNGTGSRLGGRWHGLGWLKAGGSPGPGPCRVCARSGLSLYRAGPERYSVRGRSLFVRSRLGRVWRRQEGLRVGPVLITAHCDSAPRVAASCGPAFHACWWPTGSNQRSARALSFAFMHARRVETSRTPTKTHASALTSTHATALGRGQRAHARVRARTHTHTFDSRARNSVGAQHKRTRACTRAYSTHARTYTQGTYVRAHTHT